MNRINSMSIMPGSRTISIAALSVILLSFNLGCAAWNEPARVEKDFGNSVRAMIAEQIYAPEAAQYPSLEVPSLDGTAASSGIAGSAAAAEEARNPRVRRTASPIPVTGEAVVED